MTPTQSPSETRQVPRPEMKRFLDAVAGIFPEVRGAVLSEMFCEVATAALAEARAEEREVCAVIADSFTCGGCGMDGKAGAAIRARI